MTTKHGPWLGTAVCRNCLHPLRDYVIYYSSGICPYCGIASGVTVIGHMIRVVRWEWEEEPFLFFFKKKVNKRLVYKNKIHGKEQ